MWWAYSEGLLDIDSDRDMDRELRRWDRERYHRYLKWKESEDGNKRI